MTTTTKTIPPEWKVFHSIGYAIQFGQHMHDSNEVAHNVAQISEEDRARAKDLVDRYVALCADAKALRPTLTTPPHGSA